MWRLPRFVGLRPPSRPRPCRANPASRAIGRGPAAPGSSWSITLGTRSVRWRHMVSMISGLRGSRPAGEQLRLLARYRRERLFPVRWRRQGQKRRRLSRVRRYRHDQHHRW
jgi:hypothetical protein